MGRSSRRTACGSRRGHGARVLKASGSITSRWPMRQLLRSEIDVQVWARSAGITIAQPGGFAVPKRFGSCTKMRQHRETRSGSTPPLGTHEQVHRFLIEHYRDFPSGSRPSSRVLTSATRTAGELCEGHRGRTPANFVRVEGDYSTDKITARSRTPRKPRSTPCCHRPPRHGSRRRQRRHHAKATSGRNQRRKS